MAAIGEGRAKLAFAGDHQRLLRGELSQRNFPVRCGRLELATRVSNLRGFDAELLGRERRCGLDQLFRGDVADRAGADDGARTAGVVADQALLADALAQLDALCGDAEAVANDL